MLTQLTNRVPVLFKSILDRKLDAPDLLIQDHLKIESLFMQLKLLSKLAPRLPSRAEELSSRRQRIFAQIRDDLERHSAAEEAIFYPECQKVEGLQDSIDHSFEEHARMKSLLTELSSLSMDDEQFESKLTELFGAVERHVSDEENELFPKVRKAFSRTRLERMGSQIRNHKKGKKAAKAA